MAATATYTVDPVTKNMTPVGANGMVPVGSDGSASNAGQQSMGGLAPKATSDPYQIFNSKLVDMLSQAQQQNANNNKLLGGAKDTLTTESVAPAGAKPFDPSIFSGSQVAGQETLQQGFQPAITSISTQEANTAAAMKGISDTIGQIQTATQPIVLQPGQSLVSRDGTVLKQGHSYTPQLNPLTGLIDGFDQTTGTWASEDSGNHKPSAPPSSNADIVAGIDFSGASTSTKPYATDPNYATEVDTLYTQINRSMPIPTAQGLDQFIQGQVGGKGNVSGQMIINAATQYKIDPNILAAVLGHESDFGTSGAGAKTMNAGNVGNNGTTTQTFKSWQAGVNAAAYEIARRMPGNPNAQAATPVTPVAPKSNVGGEFSPGAAAKVAKLPASIKNFVQAGPAGVAYIDETRVPDNLKASVQTLSAQAGIPYLASGDVGAMQAITQAQQNLDLMQTTASKVLGSGFFGYLKDVGATMANGATGGNAFPDFNQFNSYATEAINLIRGLAGGNGSGLRMTQSEINTAQANIPSSGDTITNALKKVQVLQGLIYTRISSVFPDAQVIMAKDGQKGYVPASQYADAIKEGYTIE